MPSLPTDDFYALLGVHAGADSEELRRAWRQLVSRWHPERAGESATATFQKLSTAYAVLSDPIARAAYDRSRRAAEPESVSPPPQPARPPTPSAMLSRLSRPLTTLIACGAAQLDEPCFITLLRLKPEASAVGVDQT
jgi:molecular chaperone DnaJ